MTEQETNYFLEKDAFFDKHVEKVKDITFMWAMSNTSLIEKAVLTQLILYKDIPMSLQDIQFNSGISITSVRRAVKSLKQAGICINHPKVDGVILNKATLW